MYVEDKDGPSLALFAVSSPLLLTFGSGAAEHILMEEYARWQQLDIQPIEQWRITARPRSPSGPSTPSTPSTPSGLVNASGLEHPGEPEELAEDITAASSKSPDTVRVLRPHFDFTIAMGRHPPA
jgi:hypothetical protein